MLSLLTYKHPKINPKSVPKSAPECEKTEVHQHQNPSLSGIIAALLLWLPRCRWPCLRGAGPPPPSQRRPRQPPHNPHKTPPQPTTAARVASTPALAPHRAPNPQKASYRKITDIGIFPSCRLNNADRHAPSPTRRVLQCIFRGVVLLRSWDSLISALLAQWKGVASMLLQYEATLLATASSASTCFKDARTFAHSDSNEKQK